MMWFCYLLIRSCDVSCWTHELWPYIGATRWCYHGRIRMDPPWNSKHWILQKVAQFPQEVEQDSVLDKNVHWKVLSLYWRAPTGKREHTLQHVQVHRPVAILQYSRYVTHVVWVRQKTLQGEIHKQQGEIRKQQAEIKELKSKLPSTHEINYQRFSLETRNWFT